MADPVTIGIVGLGIMALGGLASAAGQKAQGQAQQQAYTYQAQAAEQNAQVARVEATQEAEDIRKQARTLRGQQVAASAKSGVLLEGSPLLVIADSAKEYELEAQRALLGGDATATGYTNTAALARYQGKVAKTAGTVGAVSSLIGTAGRSMLAGGSLLKTS